MQNLAFEMSGYYHRTFNVQKDTNILLYYQRRLEGSEKLSDKYHNNEIVANYPTLIFMTKILSHCKSSSLSKSMQYVYDKTREKEPNMQTGIIADLIACLIYLKLIENRTGKIVK